MTRHLRIGLALKALLLAAAASPSIVVAQTVDGSLEDIVVTATKRGAPENVQDVPFAVTALGSDQIEGAFVRDLQNLSYSVPNVQLDDVGTTPGYANFSIRGLGINSSIPSIDPTVGVFVDGLYLGINAGVLFDTFDLDGIEVLRGPQGLLFGRNVTGGAVVIRTTTPSDTLRVQGRVAVESGLNTILSGSVSGPLIPGRISAKLAAYFSNDRGWFTNKLDGSSFGKSRQFIIRPALNIAVSDDVDLVLRYEHGEAKGDGPASQNRAIYSRQTFDFLVNDRGLHDNVTDQAIAELNIATGFGDGRITNIFGYRRFSSLGGGDIDGTSQTLFHFRSLTDQDQLSNELRYAGTFGALKLTTGLYWFTQDTAYIERRVLANGARIVAGGGQQDQTTWGAFLSGDWSFTDTLTLNLGIRYTKERKAVEVSTLRPGGCDLELRECTNNFFDRARWSDWTPKVGLQWQPDDATQVYGFWTRGFRSGGYNFRNTDPGVPPGPFDEEGQDSFEIGGKFDIGRVARINVAGFYNKVRNLQREINLPGPLGASQVIRNTADATIKGFEAEGQIRVARGVTLSGQLGYTDGQYDRVRFDLTGDNRIDDADRALALPRLSPWSYGATLAFEKALDFGSVGARVSISHRDSAAYTDNNRGTLNAATMLDASASIASPNDRLKLSIFARNLLDEVTEGGDTQLPAAFGGTGATFSPLNKGRVIGVELAFRL